MTKNEYLEQLELELKKRNVPDVTEILSEYEQHFAFKLSDGFTETEIASRLENPAGIAAQFSGEDEAETSDAKPKAAHTHRKNRGLIVVGLGFAALLLAMVVVPLYLWTASLAIGAIGLVGGAIGSGLLPGGWVPPMPLMAQLIFGLAMIALGVLLFIGALVFLKMTTQLCRAFARFAKNSLSDGNLPPRPLTPQFSHKSRRRLRTVALVAMSVFGICFVAGFVFLAVYTKSFQFWHVLEWFT
jgi:uncharacterized membrane protein